MNAENKYDKSWTDPEKMLVETIVKTYGGMGKSIDWDRAKAALPELMGLIQAKTYRKVQQMASYIKRKKLGILKPPPLQAKSEGHSERAREVWKRRKAEGKTRKTKVPDDITLTTQANEQPVVYGCSFCPECGANLRAYNAAKKVSHEA